MSAGSICVVKAPAKPPTPRVTSLCVHNRRKNECRACKGSSICEHSKRRNECKDCNGASICEHRRRRRECKECGGSSICEHRMLKRRCKQCKGASICAHNRRKNECKDCAGTSICEHNRLRRHCKQCGGTSICEHKRRRNVCRDCKGTSICLHERRKSQCPVCSKLDSPEPESAQGSPTLGQGSSNLAPYAIPSAAMETLGFANQANPNPFFMQSALLNGANATWTPQPYTLPGQANSSINLGHMAPPQGMSSGAADDKGKMQSTANTATMIALLRAQLQNLPRAPPSLPQPAMSFNLNTALNSLPLGSPPAALSRQGSMAFLNPGLLPLSLAQGPPAQSYGFRGSLPGSSLSLNEAAMQNSPGSAFFPVRRGGAAQGSAFNMNRVPNMDAMVQDMRSSVNSEHPQQPTQSSGAAMQLPPGFFFMPGNKQ
mmetsp:Transcript_60326/g.142137  ORF Transcript_60326/g.142137 Transcript_60326/m.142137 type:complete len:430 (+) Transcript_60326:183-1472(+)